MTLLVLYIEYIWLYMYTYVTYAYLSIYLSVCLSICLSIYLSIYRQMMLLSRVNVVHILILKISEVQSWRMSEQKTWNRLNHFSPRFRIIIGNVTPMPIEVPRWDMALRAYSKKSKNIQQHVWQLKFSLSLSIAISGDQQSSWRRADLKFFWGEGGTVRDNCINLS